MITTQPTDRTYWYVTDGERLIVPFLSVHTIQAWPKSPAIRVTLRNGQTVDAYYEFTSDMQRAMQRLGETLVTPIQGGSGLAQAVARRGRKGQA